MNDQPKIGVVIVTWNDKKNVISLLKSLKTLVYKNIEVHVVDNASTDDTVDVIGRKFPDVHIIKNLVNLGGTGGFNTGLKYVGKKNFKYIWLLDNDAQIMDQTLSELVKVCEADEQIGLAGCIIKDVDNKEMIVEAGGLIERYRTGLSPFLKNQKKNTLDEVIDVDYVAVCSALVNISALKEVGLMDGRYFLFWDDMEWGLAFKKKNYRVVCSTRAVVCHPTFSERDRGDLTYYYYGIRNPFLVYALHLNALEWFINTYFRLRSLFKNIFFNLFTGKKARAKYITRGISDFIMNRWYICKYRYSDPVRPEKLKKKVKVRKLEGKILVVCGRNYKANRLVIEQIAENCRTKILLQPDRRQYYNLKAKTEYLDFVHNDNIPFSIKFLLLLFHGFNGVVYFDTNPYAFVGGCSYKYESDTDMLVKENAFVSYLFKIITASVLGELISLLSMPFFIVFFVKYKYFSKENIRR
ncbi:glycosyltransferase family 2 protein [Desulfobacula sp.]|uniref:glycosyltransferase family 2 protein n=1 Tax=Desulfobacula sp. TaxID=2593537 RepID=UPI0026060F52|nr:glycosyltransferase family 2 protein [Desulfobacula sp.]